jgi:cell division septation protein DedD
MKSGFAVQVGSFSKVDNARGLRDKLVARGYTAMAKTSGSVTRVYVGPQSSRAEAEKVLKKLLADFELKGIVVNFSG